AQLHDLVPGSRRLRQSLPTRRLFLHHAEQAVSRRCPQARGHRPRPRPVPPLRGRSLGERRRPLSRGAGRGAAQPALRLISPRRLPRSRGRPDSRTNVDLNQYAPLAPRHHGSSASGRAPAMRQRRIQGGPNMHSLDKDYPQQLLAPRDGPCLSLYQPTHRAFPERQQDPIRFRNLLKELEQSLLKRYPGRDVEPLLAPLRELAEDAEFWNHPADGLAVLRSADLFRVYRLQRPVAPL